MAESEFPLMPFGEVDDPDFFDGEMRRVSPVQDGEFLFLLNDEETSDEEQVACGDCCVAQLISSVELTHFQGVVVEQFLLRGKDITEIARILSGMTPEIVHPRSVEVALICAFDKMRECECEIN